MRLGAMRLQLFTCVRLLVEGEQMASISSTQTKSKQKGLNWARTSIYANYDNVEDKYVEFDLGALSTMDVRSGTWISGNI
jgi:hypothetical protein